MSSHTVERAARSLLARLAREDRARLARPVALGLVATLCGIAQAWLIATLLAALLGLGHAGWGELGAAAAMALLQTGVGVAQERAQQAAGEAARARLRQRVQARLLALGPADERPAGERAALVVDRVEALEGYFARWLPAARLAVLSPLAVIVAAAIADPLGGLILLAGGALVPAVMALTGIGAAAESRRQFTALQHLSGRFLDRVRGLPTLVLFGRQEDEARALAAAAAELRRRTMRVLRVAFVGSAGQDLIAAAVLGCLAWRHAGLLGGGHPAPAAALFAILLVPAFFAPLRAFSAAYHERLAAQGAAAELAPLLDAPEPEGLVLEEVPPSVVVTFDDVSLRYDPARPPALRHVSFRVLPGEALVLAGPSGAGKSSVLRLLLGFRRPDSGRIAMNGRDATALRPEELRRLIAYVPQKPHLFRETLRENIRLARPEADDAAVEAAAREARVLDFASALPKGLDTLVGEGGWGLSGGQAHRVALARAFLRDRPLVLLDEPTAHLDPATEREVLDGLRRLCAGRTAIIASHSPALRDRFGKVLVLEDGQVVAGGRRPREAGHVA
ncbi:thiol reductant ABC exporter subunit CydD [Roseomonas sp. OT10]|uniref:thiol reductant ABC exporter subunit CydD n=1 Tax=Roseomonas cutis TaxID=2897332 RepID=UPI001E5069BF|nr:thiol reductant ABC exporter subunit CydD [Roseomonas sp. OT10]UFN51061.1 thiol reductant ABC exporter subunit CydD [Roseomonas sp. OT10]